jgi:hypothetical protein
MNLPVVAAVGSLLYQGFNVRIREGWNNSESFSHFHNKLPSVSALFKHSCNGRDKMAFFLALLKMMFLLYYVGVTMMVLLYES